MRLPADELGNLLRAHGYLTVPALAAAGAGAVHAYSRRLTADSGSVTVLNRRWPP